MKLFFLCLLACVSVLANAEESLTTIVITSSRSVDAIEEKVAALTVIDQAQIIQSGATTIADVLRNQAGIVIVDRFGTGDATIDMRGFGESASSNTLILIDGRRLNNADIAAPNLNSIALNNIQRIEIIKGSAGSLYGDQAVGGVINIITRPIADLTAEANVLIGSYKRRGVSARVANRFAEYFSYQLFGESVKTDNYRDNNQLEASHIFSQFGYDNGLTKLSIELQLDKEYQQLPGALLQAEADYNPQQSVIYFRNDYRDVKEKTRRLEWEQTLSSQWTLLTEYSQRREETGFVNNFRGCGDNLGVFSFACNEDESQEHRDVNSFNPRLLGRIAMGKNSLQFTAGADVERTDYEITYNARANKQKVDSYYVNTVIPVTDNLTISAGGRHSIINNRLRDNDAFPAGGKIDDNATVYTFGVAQQYSAVKVFARYDENFRFAKVDELVFTDSSQPLSNQTGKTKEFGADFLVGHGLIRALFYRLDLQNEIAYDPTANGPSGPNTGANVNFESTRRQGVNLEFKQELTPFLDVNVGLTRVDNQFTSGVFEDNAVSGVPEKTARIAFQFMFADHWRWLLETNYIGKQYLAGDNDNAQQKKASYTVTNLASHYETGNWLLNVRINNVFDERYSESQNAYGAINPSPERNVQLNATYQF